MVKQLSSLAVMLRQPTGCQSLGIKGLHNRLNQNMSAHAGSLRTCPDPLSVYIVFQCDWKA